MKILLKILWAMVQITIMSFISVCILVTLWKQHVQEKEVSEIVISKYYDKEENMLCYYNNVGGMSCIWSMEDN